jgi:hypothetical protein
LEIFELMPHVGSEIDANFYQLIHTMLEAPRKEPSAEHRSQKRNAFRTVQRIAPWDGSAFPGDREFVPITCHDLTRSGFSFLSATEPHYNMLVLEFGIRPNLLHIAAQIIHSTPVICHPSGAVARLGAGNRTPHESAPDGEDVNEMFLVGCRFTRRLRAPR